MPWGGAKNTSDMRHWYAGSPDAEKSSLHPPRSHACARLTNFILLCGAQARDHLPRADRGQLIIDGLSRVAQSSWSRMLLRRELTTGQLLLPGAHRLSRTQACTRVSCSMWACAEALGSRGESHVHVPGRLLTCGAV